MENVIPATNFHWQEMIISITERFFVWKKKLLTYSEIHTPTWPYLKQSLCWPTAYFQCLGSHSLEGRCLPGKKKKEKVGPLKSGLAILAAKRLCIFFDLQIVRELCGNFKAVGHSELSHTKGFYPPYLRLHMGKTELSKKGIKSLLINKCTQPVVNWYWILGN